MIYMDAAYIGTVRRGELFRHVEDGYLLLIDEFEVLLPFADTDFDITDDEAMDVFIYSDKAGQVLATATIPTVQKGTYGWATVADVIPHLGVFVNIGIETEILVSKDDLPAIQSVWPKIDDKLFVTLDTDRQHRLLAILASENIVYERREIATVNMMYDEVSGYVYKTGYEGSAIFTDGGYRGFIHRTMREQEPRLGEFVTGRIIDVKDDGTINVSLLPRKRDQMVRDAESILNYLQKNGGTMPYSNKSHPEHIRQTFHISKSAFKRALGQLMRQKLIEQRNGETILLEQSINHPNNGH